MRNESQTERIDTVVIGAGQAGLSVGYHLSQRGVPFVILDANERIGDQWRHRWDSLRLFTPGAVCRSRRHDVPGAAALLPHQGRDGEFPRTLCANVQTARAVQHARGTRVASRRWLSRHRWHSTIRSAQRRRRHGELPAPARAAIRERTRPEHRPDPFLRLPQSRRSSATGRPLVGAGNSGAEIALEASRAHTTWMSGRDVGHVPFDIDGLAARLLLFRLVLRVLFHRILTIATPFGRAMRPKVLHIGGPLVRTKPRDLDTAGVQRVPRVAGVQQRNASPR